MSKPQNKTGLALCVHDLSIIKDYERFRKVRAAVHICSAQWAKMTKRTKAALVHLISTASHKGNL